MAVTLSFSSFLTWGVLLSIVLSMFIGSQWYGDNIFGPKFLESFGLSHGNKRLMSKLEERHKLSIPLTCVSFICQILFLRFFILLLNISTIKESLKLAFVFWILCVCWNAVWNVWNPLLSKTKGKYLLFIDIGYGFVYLTVQSVLLTVL